MFENHAGTLATETKEHCEQCPDAMGASVFPHHAAQPQKYYLHGVLQKPHCMKTCESGWLVCVKLMTTHLNSQGPGSGTPPDPVTKLDDDQIEEISKCGIPDDWQTQMCLQNFDMSDCNLK